MARIPAYERIREALRVEAQQLPSGTQMPSESMLAERYGVTRMTVRHSLSGLAAEGVVVRKQGRGTFVTEQPLAARRLSRLTSFTEDVRELGSEVTSQILLQEQIEAPQDVRDALALDPRAHVIHLMRVRAIDGAPLALQHAWIPAGLCPALAWEPLVEGSLYRTLEERHGIRLQRAERRIKATAANREQALLLNVRVRSPLLHIEQRTFDASGMAVEFARSWTWPEYELSVLLERSGVSA